MKLLKNISFLTLMLIFMASFSQCSTAQKLQKEAPTQFGEVYCQEWVAGVQDGGSGLNLIINTNLKSYNGVMLDSAYFRGKSVKLERRESDNGFLFVGRFKTEFNQPKDIIMSNDTNEEYGNQLPAKAVVIPFELKNDECVVSYIKDDITSYYKIINVIEKERLNYPSAPPNQKIKLNNPK